jgi:glyoxylase-like metal-dependent hydrolase (beta-lactamase superfamily II)
VQVARVLKHGELVSLGGVTLRAIHAPGHTQGATVWMTSVEDGGRRYAVAFMGTTTPNGGVPLFGNPRHKDVVEDTRRAFRILKAEPEPDIVLVGHPQTMFAGTMERMRTGERPHPLLNGREVWTNQLTASEQAFERRVALEEGRR